MGGEVQLEYDMTIKRLLHRVQPVAQYMKRKRRRKEMKYRKETVGNEKDRGIAHGQKPVG